MFQKVKQMCRKAKGFIQGVSTKVKMLALTLFS
ncbi:conjugal transfer protein TraE, partial [Bacteroides thetaiotaomicron]